MNHNMNELQNIKSYTNVQQLDILCREVAYNTIHGITPEDRWYDERFEYIYNYSQLNWEEVASRFKNKDQYVHNTATQIVQLIKRLLEERATTRKFYIPTYHTMLFHIKNLWAYYDTTYIGEDMDVTNLIEGMKFL